MAFDSNNHQKDDPNQFGSRGHQLTSGISKQCSMKFRVAKKFDPPGEKSRSSGITTHGKGA